jgi:methionine-S-sulfoxide reductase
MPSKNEVIVLGGGCFWCTDATISLMKGVADVTVGYAGGVTKDPTYEQVCTGTTGHAEVARVEFDPSVIPLEKILQVFFTMHDPTSLNRQGADFGTQYRSIILYTTDDQKKKVTDFIKKEQEEFTKPIVTEVAKLDKFYKAEEYHQKYFQKNPDAGYCAFVVRPKVDKVKKKFNV